MTDHPSLSGSDKPSTLAGGRERPHRPFELLDQVRRDIADIHAEAELCERLADELPRTFEERRTLQEEARRFLDKRDHEPMPRGHTAKVIPFPPRFQLDFSELPL